MTRACKDSSSDGSWSTPWHVQPQKIFFSSIAADKAHGLALAALRDEFCVLNSQSKTGGLEIYDYRHDRSEILQMPEGLPSNDITAVAVDGRLAWIGGKGFVAVMDIQERKVLRIAYISASTIRKIQLDKTCAWIQVSCAQGDYQRPEYAGTAWSGVYRVERTTVEPTAYTVSQK